MCMWLHTLHLENESAAIFTGIPLFITENMEMYIRLWIVGQCASIYGNTDKFGQIHGLTQLNLTNLDSTQFNSTLTQPYPWVAHSTLPQRNFNALNLIFSSSSGGALYVRFLLPDSLTDSLPPTDICSGSLCLSLTYSDAPGWSQVTPLWPRVTPGWPRTTPGWPRINLGYPK